MPIRTHVIVVDTGVETLRVTGRLEVAGSHDGGAAGTPESAMETAKGQALAARIDRAIRTAVKIFEEDFSLRRSHFHVRDHL